MHSDPLDLHRAYKRTFDTPDGKAIMEDLEKRGCFQHSTFSAENGRTQFNEGRRSLVLHVKHMCDETNFSNKEK